MAPPIKRSTLSGPRIYRFKACESPSVVRDFWHHGRRSPRQIFNSFPCSAFCVSKSQNEICGEFPTSHRVGRLAPHDATGPSYLPKTIIAANAQWPEYFLTHKKVHAVRSEDLPFPRHLNRRQWSELLACRCAGRFSPLPLFGFLPCLAKTLADGTHDVRFAPGLPIPLAWPTLVRLRARDHYQVSWH